MSLEGQLKNYGEIAKKFGMDRTPLVEFGFSYNPKIKIFAKDESKNLTGSIKVRAALFNMVRGLDGDSRNKHFLDSSSGNYAKALLFLSSKLRHETTVFVPDNQSSYLRTFMIENCINGQVIAQQVANSDDARMYVKEYHIKHPHLTFLDQYNNEGSWFCHYHFTAKEIMDQLIPLSTGPTHFISGIGSGGTLIGLGKALKEAFGTRVIGLESRIAHTLRGIRCLDDKNTPGVYSKNKEIVDELKVVEYDGVKQFYSKIIYISAFRHVQILCRQ